MASLRCLPLTVTIATLIMSAPSFALQVLDDQSLSDVTGQAQGLRITEQQEMAIDSLSYIDDDGLGPNGTVGTITLSNVRQYTPNNRPTVRDFEIKDLGKGKGQGLIMTSRELAIYREVGDIAINGKSLGSFGQDNYHFADGDVVETGIYAGGYGGGNGISVDVDVPSSLSYDNWHETNGVRQFVTTNYDDPYNKGNGGIFYQDITIDIVDDGVRVGLPTIEGGFINQYNECVGTAASCRSEGKNNVTHSTAYRNINLLPDSYVLIKNAKGEGEIGLEFDAVVKQGSNLDYVYIYGEVGSNYPSSSVFEMSGHVELLSDLTVDGLRMNVDGERGLVFDFDNTQNPGAKVVSGNIGLSNITLMRSDKVATTTNPVSLGTLDVQLNLTNNSYVQIEGY